MTFLAIQNTYHTVQIALAEDDMCIDILQEEKQYASKNFVIMLDILLKRNDIKLTDLSFCVVNQGPSPFTTLRSVIASVNGLHFALNIPLIGIDGLEALFNEHKNALAKNSLVLLNAFNNDVYFYFHKNKIAVKGYKKIDLLLDTVREQLPDEPITFFGNGAPLYREKIEKTFSKQYIHFLEPMPETCSIEHVAKMGYHSWQNKESVTTAITPLYLKQHSVYESNSKTPPLVRPL